MITPFAPQSKDMAGIHPEPAERVSEALLEFNPQKYLANAAEELTFQFSEIVEAQARALEDRFSEIHELHQDADISTQQVRAVLRLMEGREGYDALRSQARHFAKAFSEGRPDAMDILSPGFFKPHERYGVLRLAMEVLDETGQKETTGRLVDGLRTLATQHKDQLQSVFGPLSAVEFARTAVGSQDKLRDQYFQLLAVKPTVRSVLDAAVEMDSIDNAESSLNAMQKAWAEQSQLEQIGIFVAVSKLVGGVKTMIAHGRELMSYPGTIQKNDPSLPYKHARTLIDIASSSVPGNLLDKLAAGILGQSQRDSRHGFFSFLHRQVRHWPDVVWASAEGKAIVLQQLVRKQST